MSASPATEGQAIAVQSYYRDLLVGTHYVCAPLAPTQRARPRPWRGGARQRVADRFSIGFGPRVDAPVAADLVASSEHALVTVDAVGAAALHLTPRMKGELREAGFVRSLAAVAAAQGGTIPFGLAQAADVRCGEMLFRITSTSAPATVPMVPRVWHWDLHRYTLGAAVGLLLVLALLRFVPADPRSLSLDIYGHEGRKIPVVLVPPVMPEPTTRDRGVTGTASAPAASAAPAGTQAPGTQPGAKRMQVKAAMPTRDPRPMSTGVAAVGERTSVLSLLMRRQSESMQAVFAPGPALGDNANEVLGNLTATPGGMGAWPGMGTGAHGAGTGESMLPGGRLGTIGEQPGGRGLRGRGDLDGAFLGPKPGRPLPPRIEGILSSNGALDKEIVRRTIRAHLNEVRYCYERELPKNPSLAGRLTARFVITPSGQVISPQTQESTFRLPSMETCVAQAVARWTFPRPQNGGLTIVSYPFVFAPAGDTGGQR